MDFSQEELLEVIERLVRGLLERAGVSDPPVDALYLAEEHLGIPVEVVEPAEADESGRRRPRARPQGSGIFLTADMTTEQQQKQAAEGIARSLQPEILHKLGIPVGAENRPFTAHVRGLMVPRILIPTRMLRQALKDCKYDVPALKERFATATPEAVALRLLDLDDPCVVSIVDDGVIAARRSNCYAVSRKLETAEQLCLERILELDLPQRLRSDGWTVQGWPIPNRPFRRIILRAVPEDV
jgi:hypothetical protein